MNIAFITGITGQDGYYLSKLLLNKDDIINYLKTIQPDTPILFEQFKPQSENVEETEELYPIKSEELQPMTSYVEEPAPIITTRKKAAKLMQKVMRI